MPTLPFTTRSPSNEPFSAAPPLDGAGNPNDLAGSPRTGGSVSSLEVGIIVGVVIAVTLLLVTIFIWRARKNRKVEQDRLAAEMVGDASATEECNSSDRKDQHTMGHMANITDTDKILTAERPERNAAAGMRGGACGNERSGWADWNHNMGEQQRRDVEEHEIVHRLQTPKPCASLSS